MPFPHLSARVRSLSLASALVLSSASLAAAQSPIPDIFVTSRNTDEVLRYDGDTGAFLGVFAAGGGMSNPVGLTFGPSGDLYVSSADNDRVLRYAGDTGAFLGIFASGTAMGSPRNLNFGPDGNLYVASGQRNRIVRYDGSSGALMGAFSQAGNLSGPTSFTFGPDGDLYVVSVITNRIKRYDGETGAFLGNFISNAVNAPHDLAFGPDGLCYVTNANLVRIRTFDPTTGAFLNNFVIDPALSAPLGMQWDGAGHFYVANQGGNEVRRYDAATGALDTVIVTPGSGGLRAPLFLAFEPSPVPQVENAFPSVAGVMNWIRVSGFEPGRKVLLLIGAPAPQMQVLRCGLQVGLFAPIVMRTLSLDESGAGVMGGVVPPSLAGIPLSLQALAPRSCQFSKVKTVVF